MTNVKDAAGARKAPKGHHMPRAARLPDPQLRRGSGSGPRGHNAGSRRAVGVAGRPLKIAREPEQQRHAIRRRPPLHQRLAARVKQQTKRLEPPGDPGLLALLDRGLRHLRQVVLPHDPRDGDHRHASGEPVVAFVGAVDLVLLLAVVVLLVIGTVMVYSASLAFGYQNQDSPSYYVLRQFEWLLVGGAGMYLAMRMDYRRWRYLAGFALLASVLLLLLLHTHLGVVYNGSRRWLRLTSLIQLEPSEVAKISLVLYAAHWFAGQRPDLRHSLRGLIPLGIVVGGVAALVFKQPDLGTSAVMVVALLMIYFVAGARWRHLALLVVVGALGLRLYLHHMPYYQVSRWQAFLNPWAQADGAGFHYVQLLNALGTGGLTGVGLGNSPAKYSMPEPHTDSIFAIIGQEWGLLGTGSVLLLFMLVALRGIRVSILAPDPFGRLLAAGLTGSIVFQALLNMAVVSKVVPFTGIPLPFISYGGSSLSISMVAAGILLNISKQTTSVREAHDSTPTFVWWRHRGAHLPTAGGRGAAGAGAALSRQPRTAISHQPSTVGTRRAAGR
jgi:cell division protein FtsW